MGLGLVTTAVLFIIKQKYNDKCYHFVKPRLFPCYKTIMFIARTPNTVKRGGRN